jgi:hypothetical protein
MNSIYDLNHRSRVVDYSDDRATGVFFDRATAQNKVVSVLEGQTFTVPEGIRITSIVNYESADVTVTFDFTNIDNLGDELFSVTWGSTPVHLTLDDSTPGIYIWSGLRDAYDWTQLVNATVQLPNDYNGTTSFTVRIDYLSTYFKEYTVTLNVANVSEWSTYDPDDFWFDTGVNSILTAPYLGDIGNPIANWTVTVYPNNYTYITLLSTSGSGGTSTWDPELLNLTLTGTNTEINSHLATLQLTTNGDVNTDFVLNYLAQGVVNGETDLTSQAIRCTLIRYLGPVRGNVDYTEETTKSISNGPLITDVDYDGSGTYTLLVTPSIAAYVKTLSSSGTGGTTNFNNSTKILTLTGTRTQVNSHINAISMLTASDVNSNFNLNYYVTTAQSGNLVGGKNQTVLGTNTAEVSNIGDTRSFVNGTTTSLFSTNTPQITDTDTATGITYTITLVSSIGILGGGAGGNDTTTWTYTGTKTQVNNQFSQITLTTNASAWQDGTISYTQAKFINTVYFNTQVTTTITLQGPRVAFDPTTAVNQTINTTEGSTFAVPNGTNIVGVNDYAVTAPTYTIDLTNCTGATLTWPSVGGTTTSIPSTGIYRISGIPTVTVWNQIKNPTVNLPNDYYGTFNFSATVNWTGGGSQSWNVTTNITDVYPLSTVNNFNYYSGGAAQTITGTPQLVDTGNTSPTWTVSVTPSRIIPGMTMSVSGGSFNATTKVLTITGTISQINARLTAISLTSPATYDLDYTLSYYATNNLNAETGIRVQSLTSNNYTVLAATRGTPTYQTNTAVSIASGPLITDTSATGLGSYTLTIVPNPTVSTATISSTATGSWTKSSITVTEPSYSSIDTYWGNDYDNWGLGIVQGTSTNTHSAIQLSDNTDNYQTLAVIDPWRTVNAVYGTGSINLYYKTFTGSTHTGWFMNQTIVGTNAYTAGNAGFTGYSVKVMALSGNGLRLVVYGTDSTYRFYTKNPATGAWSLEGSYVNSGQSTNSPRQLTLSYDGNTCIFNYNKQFKILSRPVSAPFNWTLQQTIAPTDVNASDDYMQGCLSGDSNTLMIRYPNNTSSLGYTLLIYYRSGSSWTNQYTLTFTNDSSTPVTNQNPQCYLSLNNDGNYAVYKNGPNLSVLIRSGSSWSAQQTLSSVFADGYVAPFRINSAGDQIISTWFLSGIKYGKLYVRSGSTWSSESRVTNNINDEPLYITGNFEFVTRVDTAALTPASVTVIANGSRPYYGQVNIYNYNALATIWNNTTKTYTAIGNRTNVNGVTNSLTLTPATGYTANFELIYTATTPATAVSQRNQNINHV